MSGRGILDADMATLARMAGQGWRWWIGELEALVPDRLRRQARGAFPRLWLRDGRLVPERPGRLGAGRRVAVILPGGSFLERTIERPLANARDLREMLAIEGDRLMPFAGEAGLVAGRPIGPGALPGRMRVAVAGLPMATARAMLAAAEAERLVPARLLTEGSEIDFVPALRAAGLLGRSRGMAPLLWALVGFLVLLNGGAAIWRDQAEVDRLQRLVDEQQPAVLIAQKIGHRADAARRIAGETVALRRRQDVLGALGTVDAALPPASWLQRYVWDGAGVRLSGYRPAGADVAAALRRTGRFAEVKANGADAQSPVGSSEPFDVTARVRR